MPDTVLHATSCCPSCEPTEEGSGPHCHIFTNYRISEKNLRNYGHKDYKK